VVSALVFGGRLSWLRAAWAARTVTPVVCRETVAELLRVLAYPKFRLTREDTDILLAQFLPFCETASLPSAWPPMPAACRDRDDVVFIALTLTSGAEGLVSGDADLTVLGDTVRVLSVAGLWRRLEREG
jgi:putative PIN family toxin of toxin-antitoxin system